MAVGEETRPVAGSMVSTVPRVNILQDQPDPGSLQDLSLLPTMLPHGLAGLPEAQTQTGIYARARGHTLCHGHSKVACFSGKTLRTICTSESIAI